MQIFYCPNLRGNTHPLNEEESKHIIKVLRFKNGDFIHLTDGKGGLFKAELIDDHPKHCTVTVIESKLEYGKRNYKLHMAIAPTKNISRFEWFLEKATEIGIDEITPIICEQSERKEVKYQRMEKVIVAAIKQSLKTYLPKLNQSMKFRDFAEQSFEGQKFIAYCEKKPKHLKELYIPKSNALILIGPEGDFSKEEVKFAKNNGFNIAGLGDSRLRTETAGIAACHTINLINS
jgi:16S rRNA (uracil1498-N3)-methyltransferase